MYRRMRSTNTIVDLLVTYIIQNKLIENGEEKHYKLESRTDKQLGNGNSLFKEINGIVNNYIGSFNCS